MGVDVALPEIVVETIQKIWEVRLNALNKNTSLCNLIQGFKIVLQFEKKNQVQYLPWF